MSLSAPFATSRLVAEPPRMSSHQSSSIRASNPTGTLTFHRVRRSVAESHCKSSSSNSTWSSHRTRFFRRLQASIVGGRFFAMLKPWCLPANDKLSRVPCRPLWVGMPSPYHRDECCPLVPEPRTSRLAFPCRRQAGGKAAGVWARRWLARPLVLIAWRRRCVTKKVIALLLSTDEVQKKLVLAAPGMPHTRMPATECYGV